MRHASASIRKRYQRPTGEHLLLRICLAVEMSAFVGSVGAGAQACPGLPGTPPHHGRETRQADPSATAGSREAVHAPLGPQKRRREERQMSRRAICRAETPTPYLFPCSPEASPDANRSRGRIQGDAANLRRFAKRVPHKRSRPSFRSPRCFALASL